MLMERNCDHALDGPNKQFIEKWRRATAHVFFNIGPHIFFLARPELSKRLAWTPQRGELALIRADGQSGGEHHRGRRFLHAHDAIVDSSFLVRRPRKRLAGRPPRRHLRPAQPSGGASSMC